jgi:hydroxyacylglutathione hydrolase
MNNKLPLLLIMTIVLICTLECTKMNNIVVNKQITGLETNCYLIYDSKSLEAALIDVGGPIDSLLMIIEKNSLSLKYFLLTHGHEDHHLGLHTIRNKFPNAKTCLHKIEYDDIEKRIAWAYEYFADEIEEWSKDPEFRKVIEFDPDSFYEPEIYIEDSQLFTLGNVEIMAIHTPGHTPGEICFYVGNILFSGDCLFRENVGRVDGYNSSRDAQIESVRNLYTMLNDSTIVYPGHGESTTIGYEKINNKKISLNEENLK